MSGARQRSGPADYGPYVAVAALAVVLVVVMGVWLACLLAHTFAGTPAPPANPFRLVLELVGGQRAWPGRAATAFGVAELAAALAVGGAAGQAVWRWRARRTRVDPAARHLATRRELADFSEAGAAATARRLGTRAASPGVRVGRVVGTGQTMYGTWEYTHVDIWGTRAGKALAADTPVLTPHGWTPIKALARGCRVIGADGRATTVTGVYPQGIRRAYRVHLADGASVVCDADHLWTVRPAPDPTRRRPQPWRTWTTARLRKHGLRPGTTGAAGWQLPAVRPVHFDGVLPEGRPPRLGVRRPSHTLTKTTRAKDPRKRCTGDRPLPVDPYLLGVLLAAGTLTGQSVRLQTAATGELLPLLRPLLPAAVTARPMPGSPYDWAFTVGRGGRTNPLLNALRDLGVMGRGAPNKFVPQRYLLTSPAARAALLQGLLDGGGGVGPGGQVDYWTASAQLAEDAAFLVGSLGGLTGTRPELSRPEISRPAAARERTKQQGPQHEGAGQADAAAQPLRYRLRLRPPPGLEPFRITRKRRQWAATPAPARTRAPVRVITAIEPEGEVEMVCISVSAPDGLYVVDGFVPTHNTTSRAIPAAVDAPGAAVITSNKRDIVDATRLIREQRGRVWIFDPQDVVGAEPTWWWNPLSYVTDVDRAARLAAIFAAYSRAPDAKTDSYFDPAGEELLGFLLLAAAEAHLPITTVYIWASKPTDFTPVDILRRAGHDLPAEAVEGVITFPDKQRAGIFGTAKKSITCLVNPVITRWVTPPEDRSLPELNPDELVASTDTLYSLSREGQGTAGPLVTAQTVAVVEAAERLATRSPGGRLITPFMAILDEAANVCRWRDLPTLYSHFGSRGIVLMTILQSWSQGITVWGEPGMKTLWDAANIRVYGGGSTDERFLGGLAELVGHFEMTTTSMARQSGTRGMGAHHTHTLSTRKERILDVSDLAALPRGRAVVFPSGAPPVLIQTLPWQHGPHAAAVRASLAKYAPADELDNHTLQGTP